MVEYGARASARGATLAATVLALVGLVAVPAHAQFEVKSPVVEHRCATTSMRWSSARSCSCRLAR